MFARSLASLVAALLLLPVAWHGADAQGVVPVPVGPGWVGVYKGSCMAAGGFELDATGAPTTVPHCLQREVRLTALPAVFTWSLDRRGPAGEEGQRKKAEELKYLSYEDTGVMTPPGSDAPDIWLPGGIMRATGLEFKRAPGGRALGSQCVNMTFDDGNLVMTRSAVYKLGANTVYHEEGIYELATMTAIMACRPADLLPLVCNSTTVSYRCVAYKDEEEDVDAVVQRIEAAHLRQQQQEQLEHGNAGARLRGGHGAAAWGRMAVPQRLRMARRSAV